MTPKLLREITPLTPSDCFTMFYRVKSEFNFPLHYHEEFELNFIDNAKGVKRVVGDHIDEIDDLELSDDAKSFFFQMSKMTETKTDTIVMTILTNLRIVWPLNLL